jgi:methylase of polypeptide subunit release factors
MKNSINNITLDFINDIQNWARREVIFLNEQIIINSWVFPIDSPFSYSSELTANNIWFNLSSVLDVWTWTGVQSIIASKRWAKRVLAVDIDANCLQNIQDNVDYHNLNHLIEIRKSDLFQNIWTSEKFDLIISNLPFADVDYETNVKHFLFDEWFKLHERFLSEASTYLNENGLIYIPSWTVANEEKLVNLINKFNYKIKNIITEERIWVERKLYVLWKK